MIELEPGKAIIAVGSSNTCDGCCFRREVTGCCLIRGTIKCIIGDKRDDKASYLVYKIVDYPLKEGMGQELKDLLKPPFGIIENDDDGTIIVDKNGFLQGLGEHYRMNFDQWKEFTDFITAAMNEKWERDFNESLRWIKINGHEMYDYKCPKCEAMRKLYSRYCPNCGQKLLPPKEK